jgi:hypothetical protein
VTSIRKNKNDPIKFSVAQVVWTLSHAERRRATMNFSEKHVKYVLQFSHGQLLVFALFTVSRNEKVESLPASTVTLLCAQDINDINVFFFLSYFYFCFLR